MTTQEKFSLILKKYQDLENKVQDGCADPKEFAVIAKEYSDMKVIVEAIKTWQDLHKQIDDLNEMACDDKDLEMQSLAKSRTCGGKRQNIGSNVANTKTINTKR